MSCRIIIDTGGEYTEEMRLNDIFRIAPLSITIDEETFVDETITQQELLQKIAASPNCPKSSCPSPESYMELYKCDSDNVYVVTLSAELSGSYNSAILGKNLYEEEYENKNIYVFNSKSASVGQTNICMKIYEYEKAGMDFEEIVQKIEEFIEADTIYFVLESLDALKKNGRLTGIKSVLATALNIKPVMSADENGIIIQKNQARGVKKALVNMVDYIAANVEHPEDRVIGIAHCNNYERAQLVSEMIASKVKFKDIYISETSGISTLYASEGGIIVSF
ncbi:MAG: DegV family protein [Eubacteriales bacterium]